MSRINIPSIIKSCLQSLGAIFTGVKFFLQTPLVWSYVFVAVLLNILSVILTVLIVVFGLTLTVNFIVTALQVSVAPAVAMIVYVLIILLGILVAALLFNILSSIVTAPIYGKLAEVMTIREFGEHLGPSQSVWQELILSISFQAKKSVLIFGFLLLSLPLNLIPSIGQVAFLLINLTQLVLITGLDLYEPILNRQKLNFRGKLAYILARPTELWPFLLISGLVCSIPIINILTIPICTVAAILYSRRLNSSS